MHYQNLEGFEILFCKIILLYQSIIMILRLVFHDLCGVGFLEGPVSSSELVVMQIVNFRNLIATI